MSVNTEWIMMLPLKIFSAIKTNFPQETKEKHNMTDNSFSMVGNSGTPATFPFVYFSALPSVEKGKDITGKSFNAVTQGFQVDVFDNKKQQNAREVMAEIMSIMVGMGFTVISTPNFESTSDIHRMTARFERMFGANDTL